jgi:hypothetical protein
VKWLRWLELVDLGLIAGAGLIAYGCWLIYEPAGLIVGGVLLLTGAVLVARSGREEPEQQR